MMSAFVTEAIGDSISLPVKLLLRTTYNHAGRKTLTLTIRLFSCSSASIDDISLGGFESAEAVFIGGNGLRAVGIIEALEENLGRPILTANQVAFWQALALSGSREPVVGYGRIFGLQVAAAKSV